MMMPTIFLMRLRERAWLYLRQGGSIYVLLVCEGVSVPFRNPNRAGASRGGALCAVEVLGQLPVVLESFLRTAAGFSMLLLLANF